MPESIYQRPTCFSKEETDKRNIEYGIGLNRTYSNISSLWVSAILVQVSIMRTKSM